MENEMEEDQQRWGGSKISDERVAKGVGEEDDDDEDYGEEEDEV